MKKATKVLLFFLLSIWTINGQVVINELDSDTSGIDTKEFVELKSDTPYYSLDGLVLVFFNGNTTSSDSNRIYHSIDLSGLETDVNGLVLIGNNGVSPVPSKIISNNTIQNGPDAVAVYAGTIAEYPLYKEATQTNLIDALAYSNNSTSATTLMALLGLAISYNENQFGNKDYHSIQRKDDGSYEVKLPTPGILNDGTGVSSTGVRVEPQNDIVHEGEELEIIFRTDRIVEENLTITYSLVNENFDHNDYSGPLTVVIPENTDWASVVIDIVDDGVNEGDEEMKISMNQLPSNYSALNNNLIIRIVDENYSQALWGSPLEPTYNLVGSTQSLGYYDLLNNKSGEELKQALQAIVANEEEVRKHTYGDVVDILKASDENPDNSSEVWLLYLEKGRSKLDYQMTSNNVRTWNREHIFPQSRGGFSGATPSWSDGINRWETTNANDLSAAHSDAHHIRVADGPENSARGNKSYGPGGYNGPSNTQGSWKGDVARSLFYMAIRYTALDVESGFLPTTTASIMGDLDALLEWHRNDKADDFEMNRNNIIYEWQRNRNPFIDMPELAEYIWGEHVGEIWNNSLNTNKNRHPIFVIYPNPAANYLHIEGIENGSKITINNLKGEKLLEIQYDEQIEIPLNLAKGMYLVTVVDNNRVETVKLLVK